MIIIAGNIRGVTIEIGGNTQGLTQALRQVDNDAKATQNELRAIERGLKFNPADTRLLAQQQQLLADSIQNASTRLDALRNAQERVQQQFDSGDIGVEQYRLFQRELVNSESSLRNLEGRLQATESTQQRFNDAQRQLQTYLEATGQSVDDLASTLGSRLTNSIRDGSASADQLEAAIRRISQTSGNTIQDLERFQDVLRNSGNNNLDEVRQDLDRVGQSAEEAQRDLSGLNGALAGTAGAIGAGLGVAAVSGLVEELTEANIAFTQLQVQANTFGVELGNLESGRNALSSINADVNQITETFGTLLKAGFDNEAAINNISEALAGARILYGETFSPEGLAESIGVTTQLSEATGQFADLLERSGIDLETFNASLAELNTTQERANFIANLLAEEGLNNAFNEYAKLNPEIQANSASVSANTEALAELATNLTPLVVFIRDLVTSIVEWVNANQNLALILTTIVISLGLLVGAFALLGPAIGALITSWPILVGAIGTTLGPIALVIGAIVGLGAAFVTLYSQSETFRDSVSEVFNAIRNVAQEVFQAVADFIGQQLDVIRNYWADNGSQILQAAQNAFNGIKAVIDFVMPAIRFVIELVWKAIQDVISGALNVILGAVKIFAGIFSLDFQTLWSGVTQLFKGAIDLILGLMTLSFFGGIRVAVVNFAKTFSGTISGLWTSVTTFFRGGAESTTGVIGNLNNVVNDLIRQLASGFISTISGLVTNAVARFVSLRDQILSTVRGINLFQIGADIVSGLIRGITSMAGNAASAIGALASSVIDRAKEILKINSPSLVFEEIGEFTGEGLEVGINRTVNRVADSSSRLSNAVINAQGSLLNSVGQSTRNGIAQQQIINNNSNFDMSNVIAAIQQLANTPLQPQLIVDGRNLTQIVSQYQRQDATIQGLSRGVQFT